MIRIAQDLSLPLDIVTEAVAVLGIRRSGKSYTVRRLAEQFIKAKQQVVIVDPKGDWWGIRSSADGKAPGLPITILGGEHGDVPLEAGAGELIAQTVVEQRVSVLLDLSSLRKHEVARFMGGPNPPRAGQEGFLETLYRLKAQERYRTPMGLIIDEADAIAPQRPNKGEERMLGAAEDIVRRGGQRGIGCVMATQRAAVLNKNVLTQCPFLIQLRMTGSQDIDALDEWIRKHGNPEAAKQLLSDIASLPTGDAWFWWPLNGLFRRARVLSIDTFDSGATPKPGERRIEPKQLAQVDLAALQERMAETIERAKQDDPRTLRARIAELEKVLKGKATTAVQPDPAAVERAIAQATQEAQRQHAKTIAGLRRVMDKAVSDIRKLGVAAQKGVDGLLIVAGELAQVDASDFASQVPQRAVEQPRSLAASAFAVTQVKDAGGDVRGVRITPRAHSNGNGALAAPERRILTVLAQRPDGVEIDRLAVLAGYTINGHFNNIVGGLRTKGLMSAARVTPITITPDGLQQLGDFDPLPTGPDLQAYWLGRLTQPEQRIMQVLFDQYPNPVDIEQLAQTAGYTVNGHFNNIVGSLRTKGLMTPARQPIRAADDFFE